MTRRALLLVVLLVIVAVGTLMRSRGMSPGATVPGDIAAPRGAPADTSILAALENDWAEAVVKRDTAFFRRTLAPGFIYSEDDRTISRDDLLRDLAIGSDTVENAHNEEMTMHSFGPTTIVTGWLVTRGRGHLGPFNRRYRFTDVWLKQGGAWQIVAAHDYLVPEKRP